MSLKTCKVKNMEVCKNAKLKKCKFTKIYATLTKYEMEWPFWATVIL